MSRDLFGALNMGSGQWTYLVREHMYKEDFGAFLEHLLSVYATGPIILIVDNSPATRRVWSKTGWRQQYHAPTVLPTQVLLAFESGRKRLAAGFKGQIAADRLHGSLQRLLDGVAGFFRDMTPELALIWAAAE